MSTTIVFVFPPGKPMFGTTLTQSVCAGSLTFTRGIQIDGGRLPESSRFWEIAILRDVSVGNIQPVITSCTVFAVFWFATDRSPRSSSRKYSGTSPCFWRRSNSLVNLPSRVLTTSSTSCPSLACAETGDRRLALEKECILYSEMDGGPTFSLE